MFFDIVRVGGRDGAARYAPREVREPLKPRGRVERHPDLVRHPRQLRRRSRRDRRTRRRASPPPAASSPSRGGATPALGRAAASPARCSARTATIRSRAGQARHRPAGGRLSLRQAAGATRNSRRSASCSASTASTASRPRPRPAPTLARRRRRDVERIAAAVALGRDLVNPPANVLTPAALEREAVGAGARRFDAEVEVDHAATNCSAELSADPRRRRRGGGAAAAGRFRLGPRATRRR